VVVISYPKFPQHTPRNMPSGQLVRASSHTILLHSPLFSEQEKMSQEVYWMMGRETGSLEDVVAVNVKMQPILDGEKRRI
jgi:hypothetical protein